MSALFIILVSLRMTLFSEKMLISNRWIRGLMSNLIKKSWKVSSLGLTPLFVDRRGFMPAQLKTNKNMNSDRNKVEPLLTYFQMKNHLQFSVIDTASTMILCWIKWIRSSTITIFWAAVLSTTVDFAESKSLHLPAEKTRIPIGINQNLYYHIFKCYTIFYSWLLRCSDLQLGWICWALHNIRILNNNNTFCFLGYTG